MDTVDATRHSRFCPLWVGKRLAMAETTHKKESYILGPRSIGERKGRQMEVEVVITSFFKPSSDASAPEHGPPDSIYVFLSPI